MKQCFFFSVVLFHIVYPYQIDIPLVINPDEHYWCAHSFIEIHFSDNAPVNLGNSWLRGWGAPFSSAPLPPIWAHVLVLVKRIRYKRSIINSCVVNAGRFLCCTYGEHEARHEFEFDFVAYNLVVFVVIILNVSTFFLPLARVLFLFFICIYIFIFFFRFSFADSYIL